MALKTKSKKNKKRKDVEELTDAEQEVLSKDEEQTEEDGKKVSMRKMEKALTVLEETFNLKDQSFYVTGFTDKGSSVKVSMTNGSFDLAIIIADAEAFGITAD